MIKKIEQSPAYFAAANGYGGFRSYFGTVFRSEDYTRVFVLKGGPGTGKSTLLRGLVTEAEERHLPCEAIYCSSDPHSLDGVILQSENGTFAVLDGTAPHERDAVVPGAVDSLVNLGECWDAQRLSAHRDSIFALQRKKGEEYKKAYANLHLISEIERYIAAEFYSVQNHGEIDAAADRIFSDVVAASGEDAYEICAGKGERVRLISSFGKDGYQRLDTPEHLPVHRTLLPARFGIARSIFDRLLPCLRGRGISFVRFPSPFLDEDTEAVYLPAVRRLFLADEAADTERYLCAASSPETEKLLAVRAEILTLAAGHFAAASAQHFCLEDIYRECMDFERVNANAQKLKKTLFGD